MEAARHFHVLAKPTGALCHLDCKYCFFLSKEMLYPEDRFRMADDLLETYIRQLLESQPGPDVTIAWQGGEPTLMGLDFFRLAIAYIQKYSRPGVQIEHTIQTNGTHLSDEWCEFFRRQHILVGLSLDGPREMHDLYRVDTGGRGAFDAVVRAARLMKAHRVEFNTLTTVHAGNADHPLETYHFLRDEIGARYIQLIPIVERVTPEILPSSNLGRREDGAEPPLYVQEGNLVTERTVSAEQWGRFLIEMFDEWIRFDVGKVFVQMFDAALASWVVNSEQQCAFGDAKRDTLPKYCRQCRVRFACDGGCPRNRFIETPDGEPGLNFLCAGYKAFFEHVDRPMRVMADLLRRGRYADEVMGILAAESRQAVIPA